MSKRGIYINIAILLIAALYFGGGYLYVKYVESDEIKEGFTMTYGKIYEFAEDMQRGPTNYTRYKYEVDGKEYERGSYVMNPCDDMENYRKEIMEFTYPIIYKNDDPVKSRILISPKQFEEYGLTYDEKLRPFYEKYWGCK